MAKKADDGPRSVAPSSNGDVLRLPAEQVYGSQLEALRQNDPDTPPASWKLSPRSVLTYVIAFSDFSLSRRSSTFAALPTE